MEYIYSLLACTQYVPPKALQEFDHFHIPLVASEMQTRASVVVSLINQCLNLLFDWLLIYAVVIPVFTFESDLHFLDKDGHELQHPA